MKRALSVLVLLLLWQPVMAMSELANSCLLPYPLEDYGDSTVASLSEVLLGRMQQVPFNGWATGIFLCAVIHTFMAGLFRKRAHKVEKQHRKKALAEGKTPTVSFAATLLHFLGEVEVIFGLWVVPLMFVMVGFYGWPAISSYFGAQVHYGEPVFVVIIMSIASTKPILELAEKCLRSVANIGKCSPVAWWLVILIIAPLLGSLITEPAAMTIAALLLAKQFYALKPSPRLAYGTLGLLFVNISVGGTLTHFAAPPVIMVASTWGWDTPMMLMHFGWKALIAIVASTLLYYVWFRKDFAQLQPADMRHATAKNIHTPLWVAIIHMLFLVWTVLNLQTPTLFIGGFLFFIGFLQATAHHQENLNLRGPVLVGFFLAGLVSHGVLQSWWIEPVLARLSEWPLFIGSTVLTSFNDNAAITFLASLVPQFEVHTQLQYAVMAGAVTGGGLTVIANAPNPAGQSILSKFFPDGVSAYKLFLGALAPTLVVGAAFMVLPG